MQSTYKFDLIKCWNGIREANVSQPVLADANSCSETVCLIDQRN